jgi:hypothetical protein
MALAGAKSLRGAFGKLIKQPKIKPKKAGDLVNKPSKAGKVLKKATKVFPFVGAKSPKKVPLKNTKATTIRGINIGTKAGKKFGETVKNQPKRIAGQDPVGMRPKEMKDGGGLKEIPEGNKGLPKLPTEVRNKMGFKKDGGLVSATAKLKAQGLKNGGPVRGKARGMGAATKGGGYNV